MGLISLGVFASLQVDRREEFGNHAMPGGPGRELEPGCHMSQLDAGGEEQPCSGPRRDVIIIV